MRIWKYFVGFSFLLIAFGVICGFPPFVPALETFWTPMTLVFTLPLGLSLTGLGATALYRHFRVEKITITVIESMAAAFLAQERRLLRKEELKQQLHEVTAEIETFNATMDADTRRAWQNRRGPYGK